jgi:peptidyl-tRNA hydrolase
MSHRFTPRLVVGVLVAVAALAAQAADVRVTCEKRTSRSKASVDGSDLAAGQYRAVLKSGTNTARSGYQAAVGDEVQFDFDSRAGDIAEGATAIPSDFIVDGRVKGFLQDASGVRVSPVVTAICRIR